MSFHTCRVCKGTDFETSAAFKYGTRHYAHGRCGLKKFGAKFLDMIPAHYLGMLPYQALEEHGLLKEVERRLDKQKKAA